MDWAAGYNPSGFQKAVGEVAEFAGALHTVKPILNKALGKESVDVLGKRQFLNAKGTEKVAETFWKGTKYRADSLFATTTTIIKNVRSHYYER